MKFEIRHRTCRICARILAAILTVVTGVLTACDAKNTTVPQSSSKSVQETIEKGPVQLTVIANRDEISVGENVELTITVLAETGVAVELPRFENQMGQFEIVAASAPPDIPEATKRRWTHQYTLRTLEAGEQQIPPATVKFTDPRGAQADATLQETELSSKPLIIRVNSLLAGEFNPEQFRDVKGEVAVPLPWNKRPWLIGAGAALLTAAAAVTAVLFARRQRQRLAIAAPPPPPHLWAVQQLEKLATEGLIERGEHHAYFYRLSAIVREYIERRFGIMASEQTTSEFLREAQRSLSLTDSHRQLLRDFLTQADMVKFARFQPPQHDSENAMDAARKFVDETTPAADALTNGNPTEAYA